MKKDERRPVASDSWKYDLDEMILSEEEASLFTEEYLAEAIEEAMKRIRRVEALWRAPFSQVLPLRDMLLARYLLGSGLGTPPLEALGAETLHPNFAPTSADDVLDEARTFERLNQFASERDLGVPDYVRLLTMVTQRPDGYSSPLTDEDLDALVLGTSDQITNSVQPKTKQDGGG